MIVLLIVVVIVVGVINKDKLMAKSFEQVKLVVMQQIPETMPSDSVAVLFDSAIEKIQNGQVDPQMMADVFTTFKNSMGDQKLDSLETATLLNKVGNL
ncbi:hypothetical protein JW948_01355 [bacterium]|nr:hypothetical protein [bacterium]